MGYRTFNVLIIISMQKMLKKDILFENHAYTNFEKHNEHDYKRHKIQNIINI